MTTVTILPVPTGKGSIIYQGMAGGKRSQGQTAGAALDAMITQLSEGESVSLVIVQPSPATVRREASLGE